MMKLRVDWGLIWELGFEIVRGVCEEDMRGERDKVISGKIFNEL